jgi:peptidoglycan/LPS O-acetylase OafA/YrhL
MADTSATAVLSPTRVAGTGAGDGYGAPGPENSGSNGNGRGGRGGGERPAEGTTRPGQLTYRPSLDGLRAVAVTLVILFHAEWPRFSGGFVGVDMFFVLSGYLVTSMVLVQRGAGKFRLVEFYSRRARRLLPAALVTIVGIGILWLAIASQVDRAPVAEDARWAALYLSNWHFANTSVDYFASNNSPSPFLHFWSLSVEEQFYLAWPAMMMLVWAISGRRQRRADAALARVTAHADAVAQAALPPRTGEVPIVGDVAPGTGGSRSGGRDPRSIPALAIVAGTIATLSLGALAWSIANDQANYAYYGTHTRAYQLLFGALLAMAVQTGKLREAWQRFGHVAQVVALGGLFLLATSLLTIDPAQRGVVAALCTITLLAALELRSTGVVGRVLSVGPLVYLGQISYATYLWHYPVIVAVRRFADIPPLHLAVVATLLSMSIAALSLRLVELPIRTSSWLSRPRLTRAVVAAGLVLSLVVGLALPVALRSDRRPDVRTTQAAQGGAALVAGEGEGARIDVTGLDLDAASALPEGSPAGGPSLADTSCTRVPLADCIAVAGSGNGKKVLLVGDSHAGMLLPAFRSIARSNDLTLAMASATGCPWQVGLVFANSNQQQCLQYKQAWYDTVIPQYDPDVIVFVSRATDHADGSGYAVEGVEGVTGLDGLDQGELMARTASRTIEGLARAGRQFVLVEPLPVSPVNSAGCLSGAEFADECSFMAYTEPSPAETAYRGFEQSVPGTLALDMDPWACPRLPACDSVVDGTVVRKDHDHLTPRMAASLAGQLDLALHDAGVI